MTRKLSSAILLLVVLTALRGESGPPVLLLGDGADLAAAKARLSAGDPLLRAALDQLRSQGVAELTRPLVTVVDKSHLPPSGDPHDYYSLSPYWWPDPAKPDGSPYLWKDGQTNPERETYDFPRLLAMVQAVDTLAPLYAYTGDARYAERAARWLRAWFIDPETRMNPNGDFAQFRIGHGLDQEPSTIESSHLRGLPDDSVLLVGSAAWSAADDAALRHWFGQLATWLATNARSAKERAAPNNHGSWDAVQVVEYSLYGGDKARAKEVLAGIPRRVASQIKPDGEEPNELRRTKALHYSNFNNEALVTLVRLSQKCGVDLQRDPTVRKGLRASLDFLSPYADGFKPWPYSQISKLGAEDYAGFADTYWNAALAFRDPALLEVVQRLPGLPTPPPRLVLLAPWLTQSLAQLKTGETISAKYQIHGDWFQDEFDLVLTRHDDAVSCEIRYLPPDNEKGSQKGQRFHSAAFTIGKENWPSWSRDLAGAESDSPITFSSYRHEALTIQWPGQKNETKFETDRSFFLSEMVYRECSSTTSRGP